MCWEERRESNLRHYATECPPEAHEFVQGLLKGRRKLQQSQCVPCRRRVKYDTVVIHGLNLRGPNLTSGTRVCAASGTTTLSWSI